MVLLTISSSNQRQGSWKCGKWEEEGEKFVFFFLVVGLHLDLSSNFHFSVKTRIGGTFATTEGQKHFRLILLAGP